MKNLAGCKMDEGTKECAKELEEAGIPLVELPESISTGGEVNVRVKGYLHYWKFRRAWYYWVCEGPGLPVEYAMPLHEKCGTEVRVHGHCCCPSPIEWCEGTPVTMYHVDTQEGLKVLADTIKKSVKDALEKYPLKEKDGK